MKNIKKKILISIFILPIFFSLSYYYFFSKFYLLYFLTNSLSKSYDIVTNSFLFKLFSFLYSLVCFSLIINYLIIINILKLFGIIYFTFFLALLLINNIHYIYYFRYFIHYYHQNHLIVKYFFTPCFFYYFIMLSLIYGFLLIKINYIILLNFFYIKINFFRFIFLFAH